MQALAIEFVGVERVHLDIEKVIKLEEFHRGTREIAKLVNVISHFPDKKLAKGQYSFPFAIYLPEWLPDSIELSIDNEYFAVEYTVRAQLTPVYAVEMVTDMRLPQRFSDVSLYRGSRVLYVC